MIKHIFLRLLKDEAATTSVEYAVMLALIIVACMSSIALLGSGNSSLWGNNSAQLNAAGFGSGS